MNAEPVAPQADTSTGGEQPPKMRAPMGRCVKCGKWKFRTPDKDSEFIYYPSRQTWSGWCKRCYAAAVTIGQRAAKARRAGDQAGALIPGEGELQRSVRRGDTLMSVSQWIERGDGAIVLLSGEAVYQLETRDDGTYVRILRRAPLSKLPPVAVETFLYLRGKEEGVYYS